MSVAIGGRAAQVVETSAATAHFVGIERADNQSFVDFPTGECFGPQAEACDTSLHRLRRFPKRHPPLFTGDGEMLALRTEGDESGVSWTGCRADSHSVGYVPQPRAAFAVANQYAAAVGAEDQSVDAALDVEKGRSFSLAAGLVPDLGKPVWSSLLEQSRRRPRRHLCRHSQGQVTHPPSSAPGSRRPAGLKCLARIGIREYIFHHC